MAEKRRKFDPEFREGAVRIVTETGKTIAEVADDLGVNETTLASRVSGARRTRAAPAGESDVLEWLRRDNAQLKRDNKELAGSGPVAGAGVTFSLAVMGQGLAGTRDAQIRSSPIGFLLLA
ncbi:transposase [Streptomyces phaeochromogenes]|uniref:transposase n=1 Tax=Streptomyces phaeochromogenes TaxID=1923 RepID=UPI0033CAE9B7